MADASAALFYGVYIETAYLCFASDAYQAEKDSLLAIDLIRLRRRKDALSTTTANKSITKVPGEVWEMIKLQIISDGMDESEESEIDQFFHLADSANEAEESDDELDQIYNWSTIISNERFYRNFDNSDGIFAMFEERSKEIKKMLKSFGLVLPFKEYYFANEEYPETHMHVLSAIGLQFPATNTSSGSSTSARNSVHADINYSTNHKTLTFSKQAFNLPSDADQRIQRFLKLFNLESKDPDIPVVDRPPPKSKPEQTTPAPKPTKPDEESKPHKVSHESGCCSDSKLDPHWRLWTSAYSNL